MPFDALVVSQVSEYGDVVSSDPRFAPSSLNWTPETPMLSVADADRVTDEPLTVELFEGVVREITGKVVSGVDAPKLVIVFADSEVKVRELVVVREYPFGGVTVRV